ncbi:unnamed protein product [Gemmata massiliana]|uniref:Uncharacterized protein n=1 Tax=Gemmata massiliana TaxID=1210884 RepID=A0A6P2DGE3_9BACT|nr:hypothetical protein [Gemmata massiliana]VTS00584.1 unnamed protein product [Gemmata massiliana]
MKLILPVLHLEWQVLRAVGGRRKPVPGALRLAPTRRTKDGSFLTALVSRGLLAYAVGSEGDPFGATYALTPLGCTRPSTSPARRYRKRGPQRPNAPGAHAAQPAGPREHPVQALRGPPGRARIRAASGTS